MDLLVVVAIPIEDVPEERQLGLQTVFITERSGPVLQSRSMHSEELGRDGGCTPWLGH
jgi:hypothetical protein